MYSRDTIHTDGNDDFLKDELKGKDLCNHGINQHYEEKYRKGYNSIPAEHLITIQTNKYSGNK